MNGPAPQPTLALHPGLFHHPRRGEIVHVAHGPDAVNLWLGQHPVRHGSNDFGHVAPPPVFATDDVAHFHAMTLRPDIDRAGQSTGVAKDDDPREWALTGPGGGAVSQILARVFRALVRPKAHVAGRLGVARIGRVDRLGVVHRGLSQPQPRGLDRRGRLHVSSATTTLPVAATVKVARGGTTRVEPSSSITAGPAKRSPTESRARSYTIVSTKPFASGNQTG